MRKTREILRLKWEKDLSIRQIAVSLGIARSTVSDHLARAELARLSWPLPDYLTDTALEELLFPSRQADSGTHHQPDFTYIHEYSGAAYTACLVVGNRYSVLVETTIPQAETV